MAADPFKLQHDIGSGRSRSRSVSSRAEGGEWGMPSELGNQDVGWLTRGVAGYRWWMFCGGLAAAFALVVWRLVSIQVLQGSAYRDAAEGNRIRTVVVPAPRGLIVDRYGTVLVENQPTFALYVVAAQLPPDPAERQRVVSRVAASLTTSSVARLQAAAARQSYVPELVAEGLPHPVAISLMVDQLNLPGIEVVAESTRRYVDGESLAPVVGYVRKISADELEDHSGEGYRFTDRIGKAGLEKQYEQVLRGRNGEDRTEVDSQGRLAAAVGRVPATVGRTVQLNLDAELQSVMYRSLAHWSAGKPAAAVALDPTTGGILGLVSLPSYDANLFNGVVLGDDVAKLFTDPGQPLFNRAVSAQYPSGSTIKPMEAAAALETGVITPQTTVMSTGGISVGQWFFPDWKAGGHGRTDVVKAIADSVNTFFYAVGGGWGDIVGLGPDRLAAWLERFGWGSPLGIDLPGEASGVVPTPAWKARRSTEPWYIGDTYHMAIGQGDVLVTPLQVAVATAAIANGGTLYQPQVAQAIGDGSGAMQKVAPKAIADHLVSPESIAVVRRAMRTTVTDGSGRRLATLPIPVAGKTGTAQASSGEPHAWFTAFAPYDSPKLVLAIIIEHGVEGSTVAVPVAQDVLQWYEQRRLGATPLVDTPVAP